MKLVLLSGGSGTRLWPLSNEYKPKQFLKVLKNNKNEYESMLQRIVRQIETANLLDHTFISTTKSQVELMKSQLGNKLPLIVEPDCRDTFPAIALSFIYLYSELEISLDEVICVCPVDLYVGDSFFHTIKQAEQTLNSHDFDLAMIGIRPTYPSEKYGYIVPENLTQSIMKVNRFVEKPQQEQAIKLIEQNAMWNSGVFCFKLKFLLDLLIERNLPLTYQELLEKYEQFPKISFDYEVAEKINTAVVVVYDGVWNDMGTWDTLAEKIDAPIIGKGILSNDSQNTHIINKLDIPVLVLGLSNVVIVINDNGILVSDKSNSVRLKDFLRMLNN